MRNPVALLLAVTLLAGCAGGGGGPDEEAVVPEAPAPAEEASNASVEAAPVLPSTLHFSPDGLVPDAPDAGRVPLDWDAWGDFLVTNAMPSRFASAPAESSYLVTSMSGAVQITTDGAAVASTIIGEVPAWVGTTEGMVGSFFGAGPGVLAAGDVAEVQLEWSLPLGGLVVPAGEPLVVDLATTYLKDPAASEVFLLVGAEAMSHVLVEAAPVALPVPEATEVVLSESGSLQGGECLWGESEGSSISFQADVPADAVELRVALVRTGGTPAGDDLDVKVHDATGTRVGGTSDPSGTETLVLYAPNLAEAAPGAWSFEVTACTPQQAEFDLEVAVGLAGAPP